MKPGFQLPDRLGPALVVGLLACALLVGNAAVRPSGALEDLKAARRYWEDVSIGISAFFYAEDEPGVPTIHVGIPVAMDYRQHYREYLIRMVNELDIKPWQFWRSVPIRPSLKKDRIVARDVDDPGRPGLIAASFRLAGAALPYFGLWFGILFACPVLIWMAWELWRAGYPMAGTVLPLLIASSAFVVDTLTLAYSAQAFYTLAVLLLVVVSVHAALSRSTGRASLVARLLIGGFVFAVCVLGRMSVMAILPAFLVAIVMRAAVLQGVERRHVSRTARVATVAVALFMVPYGFVRSPNHHAVWGDVWEGLGDFDREYGHVWSDSVLRQVLIREGMTLAPGVGVEFENDQSEVILKRLVVGAIRNDPGWYVGILAQRTWATLTQSKLWPHTLWDGYAVAPVTHPNQGRMDVYYSLASSADIVAIGPLRMEVPMSLMIAPTLGLLLMYLRDLRMAVSRSVRARWHGYFAILFLLAMGTAALPICITTASAFEVQSFVVVYFAGAAFFTEEVRRGLGRG